MATEQPRSEISPLVELIKVDSVFAEVLKALAEKGIFPISENGELAVIDADHGLNDDDGVAARFRTLACGLNTPYGLANLVFTRILSLSEAPEGSAIVGTSDFIALGADNQPRVLAELPERPTMSIAHLGPLKLEFKKMGKLFSAMKFFQKIGGQFVMATFEGQLLSYFIPGQIVNKVKIVRDLRDYQAAADFVEEGFRRALSEG